MNLNHKGKKICVGCRHLFPKQELIKGKFNKLYCSSCIKEPKNASSKQNYLSIKEIVGGINA